VTNPVPRKCDRCGQAKTTALVTFKQNISYIFRRQEREFSGWVCFGCMTGEFIKFEFVTLIGTWWGIIGCLLGPVFILTNLLEYLSGSFLVGRDAIRLHHRRRPSGKVLPPLTPEMIGVFDRMITGKANPTVEEIQKAKRQARQVKTATQTTNGATPETAIHVPAANSLEGIIAPYEGLVEVLLPKNEFMTLEIGLSHLTEAQLSQIGLSQTDRWSMLDPFIETMKQWFGKDYESIPEHVSVTALMSVWSKIMGLLASWQPADLLQEEELENLKAIIGGAMTAGRNASPRRGG
jgi:hypothetical protein